MNRLPRMDVGCLHYSEREPSREERYRTTRPYSRHSSGKTIVLRTFVEHRRPRRGKDSRKEGRPEETTFVETVGTPRGACVLGALLRRSEAMNPPPPAPRRPVRLDDPRRHRARLDGSSCR